MFAREGAMALPARSGSASDRALGEQAFGIDIGGSGIKGAIVDVVTGRLATERRRIPTPQPATWPP
jgi:polyphosphate glucokinase